MKNIILLLLALFSVQIFAADRDDYWLQRDISIGQGRNDYGKKVYGQSARSIMQNVTIENSTKEEVRQLIKRSIAVDKPSATKVGPSMLKRLYSPQSIAGTAVVSGLLAAIGWVMEDGIYVKKIPPDESDNSKYMWQLGANVGGGYIYKSKDEAGRAMCANKGGTYSGVTWTSEAGDLANVGCKDNHGNVRQYNLMSQPNPDYDPNKEPKLKTVPLTGALLGAAMIGRGYKDPDPNFNNDSVNTDDYTGVKEIYEHDPSGVGDEVADDMDDKLKNAKPTDDGKRSWIGDPRYSDEPTNDKDRTQDRSWSDSGDEATGETTPKTDPATGEQTGGSSITIQFPVFCSWAAKMCQWYDDWKVSDKRDTKFQEKVQEHYDDEKTFWDKVTDWFDWTKEAPEDKPDTDQPDIDDQGIFSRTFDTVFSLSKECPPDIPFNLDTQYLKVSDKISLRWLCIIFTSLGYPLLFASHCIGIWILYEAVIRKEIKVN